MKRKSSIHHSRRRTANAAAGTNGKEMTMITRFLMLITALTIAAGSLSACNTVQGAGRDIEKGGQKLQDEAVEHKRY
jgi:predicted small secreted protein